jgi:hypothetical protein
MVTLKEEHLRQYMELLRRGIERRTRRIAQDRATLTELEATLRSPSGAPQPPPAKPSTPLPQLAPSNSQSRARVPRKQAVSPTPADSGPATPTSPTPPEAPSPKRKRGRPPGIKQPNSQVTAKPEQPERLDFKRDRRSIPVTITKP